MPARLFLFMALATASMSLTSTAFAQTACSDCIHAPKEDLGLTPQEASATFAGGRLPTQSELLGTWNRVAELAAEPTDSALYISSSYDFEMEPDGYGNKTLLFKMATTAFKPEPTLVLESSEMYGSRESAIALTFDFSRQRLTFSHGRERFNGDLPGLFDHECRLSARSETALLCRLILRNTPTGRQITGLAAARVGQVVGYRAFLKK